MNFKTDNDLIFEFESDRDLQDRFQTLENWLARNDPPTVRVISLVERCTSSNARVVATWQPSEDIQIACRKYKRGKISFRDLQDALEG